MSGSAFYILSDKRKSGGNSLRLIQASEITKNICEMCIEANHFLSQDMRQAFDNSKEKEKSQKFHCVVFLEI